MIKPLTHSPLIPQSSFTADIDERRRASWLHSGYSSPSWVVSDSRDQERTSTIDFGFRLANGQLLHDVPGLCATAKEYAWWVRDARFSRIDDAHTHASMVRNLMGLAHALSLRNIWSFAHVQPYDVEQLVEECRYGADAVFHASERVEAHLEKLAAENAVKPKLFGGLPRYIIPSTKARTTIVHVEQLMAACKLPSSASMLPRVSTLVGRAASLNGMTTRSRKGANELELLKNVTVQSLQRWLDPLEQLHSMRHQIEGDALQFKPFPQGAARVAAVKGVGVARTPIPPPTLVLYLLEHSARWAALHSAKTGSGFVDHAATLRMATACWILIAAFTARRSEEISDLCEGCLRGSEQTGWWLHVYIEKTLQRKEWIPIPTLVAKAILALTAISERARKSTGTTQLFQWLSPSGKVIKLSVGRFLDDFAAAVEVPPHRPPQGQPIIWHWHPHQFRRFFAVLYFYRFEGATIEALSHYLRHFSLEMTKRYVTKDPEVAAIWTDVEWGYTGHVARSIVAGERSVSGAAGERLKKTAQRLLDLFRQKLQVTSPERAGSSLALIMQRKGMVLTPKPWVTCSCPRTRDAAAVAACRRQTVASSNAVGPDFAHAGAAVCSSCTHAVTEGARLNFVDAELIHLEAADASKPRDRTLFGLLEESRLIELRGIRHKYESASPLRLRIAKGEESL